MLFVAFAPKCFAYGTTQYFPIRSSSFNMQYAIWNMQYAICNMQYHCSYYSGSNIICKASAGKKQHK